MKSTNLKDRIGITKVPLHLVPLIGVAHTALALLDGLCKYGPWNWRQENVAATVYVAACKRHLDKWLEGRNNDVSGAHELGHAVACLMIIMDAEANGCLVDDRPPPSKIPEVLDNMKSKVEDILRSHGKLEPVTPTINSVTFDPPMTVKNGESFDVEFTFSEDDMKVETRILDEEILKRVHQFRQGSGPNPEGERVRRRSDGVVGVIHHVRFDPLSFDVWLATGSVVRHQRPDNWEWLPAEPKSEADAMTEEEREAIARVIREGR